MTLPTAAEIYAALDATWPAARIVDVPGWRVRQGDGGGNRVAAATATVADPDIAAMEAAQAALGQPPLVVVRSGEAGLDRRLETAGYRVKDPVIALAAPVGALAEAPPPVTVFLTDWPPIGIQIEIWEAGGIGPARLAVMDRVAGPRVALLGRGGDRPAGAAFAAVHGRIAMVHALAVSPRQRRQGIARHMMRGAALWAGSQGARWLVALVTEANAPARALYASLGLEAVEKYHYRAR